MNFLQRIEEGFGERPKNELKNNVEEVLEKVDLQRKTSIIMDDEDEKEAPLSARDDVGEDVLNQGSVCGMFFGKTLNTLRIENKNHEQR